MVGRIFQHDLKKVSRNATLQCQFGSEKVGGKMTKSTQCRCTEELEAINLYLYLVAAGVLGCWCVLLVWAVYARCIRVSKKTKAEEKAEKEWLADQEWGPV